MRDVTKIYDKSKTAVNHIDLDIQDGSFTVLLGPSGCGKTTLLRMVAGLEDITSGELLLDGNDVTRVDASNRGIAMVFQNYALYPHMTVRKNIEYGLKNAGMARDKREQMIREVVGLVGLSDYIDSRPGALSGGQRQRVALARAISKSPKVFLMDEPLSNLDAKLRNQMRTELIRLHQKLKATFVYVTHDQMEAMTMGDTIVIMDGGKVVQKGTPRSIYNDPEHVFVAQFIGDPGMNVIRMDNGAQIAFRPQKVSMSSSYSDGLDVRGTVVTREMLGADMLYSLDTPFGVVGMKCPDNHVPYPLGEIIRLHVDRSDLYFFEASGQRIHDEDAANMYYGRFMEHVQATHGV
jgi:sn-glycerol 3-phosphate transport system ATP-binding protein